MSFQAQFGEDVLLDRYFQGRECGYCVEVGASSGVDLSNTYHFEQLGWRVLLVEPNPEAAQSCRHHRPGAVVRQCAAVAPEQVGPVAFELAEDIPDLSALRLPRHSHRALTRFHGRVKVRRISVEGRTLDELLAPLDWPRLDFVTIDVEGSEADVLRGFSLGRWQPEVVIVERNGRFPQPAVLRHFHRHGYGFIRRTGVNDWFVRRTEFTGVPWYRRLPFALRSLAKSLMASLATDRGRV